MSSTIEVLKYLRNLDWVEDNVPNSIKAIDEALLALEQKEKGCPKCKNKIKLGLYCNKCYQIGKEESKKQGALLFWKKLKVKIENEDFEEWIDIDTNDKSLNKDKLIEWVEKELE